MCGGNNKHHVVAEITHTTHNRQTRKHKGVCCVTCVLAKLRAHYTTHTIPQKEKKEKQGKEEERKRVVLDGGGARLADAATRHHLTQTTNKKEKKRTTGEQNKHQRTQTIQKTSTRQSTSNGHHTLPSMRDQAPIQQQRTTQTQLSRGRPHNPSLVRRIQSPRQRKSPLRQMQQSTRQRTRRKGESTPLPEKRGRKRQTTHRSHANTTQQHVVNTHRHSNKRKTDGEERRGTEKRRENKTSKQQDKQTTRETQWCSGITCVLAGLRAHYPEHHEQKRRRKGNGEDKRRDRTHRTHHTHRYSDPHTINAVIPQ